VELSGYPLHNYSGIITMRPEAEIVIDGTRSTESEAMVVRVAVGAFVSELSDGSLGFVIDGVPINGRYQSEAAYVHTLLVKSRNQSPG
jgi:hypothetical protein